MGFVPTGPVWALTAAKVVKAIREAAKDGCCVLIASIDAADLAVLCDRVLVFRNGAVTGELTGELNQDDIIHATFGSPRQEPRDGPKQEEKQEERWAG